MKSIEEYNMTNDEIEIYKKEALIRFLKVAGCSNNPEITFVVGQPGSGKSRLSRLSREQIKKNDANNICPVELNADIVAKYHKNYEKLLSYLPEERLRITRKFVNPAMAYIQNELLDKNVSIVMECTLNSEKKLEFMKNLKNRGYKVNINVMIVNDFLSRISCLEREAKMLKEEEKPRAIDRESHDGAYINMVKTLSKALQMGCCDSINLYKRVRETKTPQYVCSIDSSNEQELIKKINEERNVQAEYTFQESEIYQERLKNVENIFKVYYLEGEAKDNAFSRLRELEEDFKRELERREENLR